MWRKALAILLVVSFVDVSFSQDQIKRECEELAVRYATKSCSNGNERNSKCDFICNEGYVPSVTSPKSRRCRCTRKGGCSWSLRPIVCEPEQSDSFCPIPDYQRAQVGVLDSWPGGAILRVNLRPKADTKMGWSFVLKLSRALEADVKIESGKAKLRERSEDGKIIKFWNQPFNRDISRYQLYSVYLEFKNLPEDLPPHGLIGLAGFYDSKPESSLSCIGVPSPVEPVVTERPIFTVAPVTPTQRPVVTVSPITTPVTPIPTRKPTVDPGANCEILDNNGDQPGYLLINPGWQSSGKWSFNARAEAYADERGQLNDWTFKLEFDIPVSEMEVYVGTPEKLHDGYVWLIHPKNFNTRYQEKLQILFMGHIEGGSVAPSPATTVTTFCRDGGEPSRDREGTFTPQTTTPPPQVSTTTDPDLVFERSTEDPTLTGRCLPGAVESSLPSRSQQTNVNVGYTASPQSHQLVIDNVPIDYNQVLHASLLFYEAQRSGKLPADNRIPWRGDSGLNDGCDVGLDLTGGYYDAGDNVKFGFPMAWSMTTVAWSIIEFGESYSRAGLHDRALDMIKWGTDYFMKAHPQNNELYVQVTDAQVDHSMWQRPEDARPNGQPNKSYKIDGQNGGSDVAAETAAALAAASIIFKNTDPEYSALCLQHAKALFSFADTVRRSYHQSVPAATDYYKSWNGYEDELLWGLAWLYKATGEDIYLNKLELRYQSKTPLEFSWDDKTAGVQVLLAQETGLDKYKQDVANFMNQAMNIVDKTTDGLTWLRKWGPNRYAANYAAIALFAANVELPNSDQYRTYAQQQIRYMLGENKRQSSYVIGIGRNPPQRPHHRGSSCPSWNSLPVAKCTSSSLQSSSPNPHVLFGALVGGPDQNGDYDDLRTDYVANEVALDYNAGFQAAVAGLEFFNIEDDL